MGISASYRSSRGDVVSDDIETKNILLDEGNVKVEIVQGTLL